LEPGCRGWNVSDRSRVLTEIDTKQSDFIAKSYKNVSETLKNDLESKYADYLLLDNFGAPLAIVEAKRWSGFVSSRWHQVRRSRGWARG